MADGCRDAVFIRVVKLKLLLSFSRSFGSDVDILELAVKFEQTEITVFYASQDYVTVLRSFYGFKTLYKSLLCNAAFLRYTAYSAEHRKVRVTTAPELSAFISVYKFLLLFQLQLNSFFFFTYSACHWLAVTHFSCLCLKTFPHPVTHQRPTNYSIYNRLRNSFCLTGATENVLICNTSSFPKEVLSSTSGGTQPSQSLRWHFLESEVSFLLFLDVIC